MKEIYITITNVGQYIYIHIHNLTVWVASGGSDVVLVLEHSAYLGIKHPVWFVHAGKVRGGGVGIEY